MAELNQQESTPVIQKTKDNINYYLQNTFLIDDE